MACRLKNTGRHPLRIDLRGGAVLYLQPGDTSPPLRDEMLYGNTYVDEWLGAGLVARIAARMDDVHAAEESEKPPSAAPAAGPAAAEPAAPPEEEGERGSAGPHTPPRSARSGTRRQGGE